MFIQPVYFNGKELRDMVEVVEITLETMDYNIKTEIAEVIEQAVNVVHQGGVVTQDDFKAILISGLRESVIRAVEEYYDFLSESVVKISDQDMWELFEYMRQ